MDNSALKILIVDDHPLILNGLERLLQGIKEIRILHLCKNAVEVMQAIKEEVPDVALLDINLPDVNGIDLCKKIKGEFNTIQIIALTTFSQRSYVHKMIEAGASGYLLKNAQKEDIVEAIHEVFNGGTYFKIHNQSTLTLDESPANPTLTPREKEVLSLIGQGFTNTQIAEQLFVSVLTVNSHRKNLLNKFKVTNTAMLIKQAILGGTI